ncbi:MAG: hypothetical protein R2713_11910 [Ilumatobacteraceae bacterium]
MREDDVIAVGEIAADRAGRAGGVPCRRHRGPFGACAVVAVVWAAIVAAATLRLWWAFVRTDLRFAYVASHTWVGERWWYRAVGLWSGMEGRCCCSRRCWRSRRRWPCGRAAGAARGRPAGRRRPRRSGSVSWRRPWRGRSSGSPCLAVQGFGIEPILRHPAMIVHPPLLSRRGDDGGGLRPPGARPEDRCSCRRRCWWRR